MAASHRCQGCLYNAAFAPLDVAEQVANEVAEEWNECLQVLEQLQRCIYALLECQQVIGCSCLLFDLSIYV